MTAQEKHDTIQEAADKAKYYASMYNHHVNKLKELGVDVVVLAYYGKITVKRISTIEDY